MTLAIIGPRTIVLVACVAKKASKPRPAKDLYLSPWFVKARAVAEQAHTWRILSAKHGLVHPDDVLTPYDETLLTRGKAGRQQWSRKVLAQILAQFKRGDRIVFLAGELYRSGLEAQLKAAGYDVVVPMRGLTIGRQLAWLGGPATV